MLNNLYIYDCEVFKHDWLFVFKQVNSNHHVVIKNDYDEISAFMDEQPLLAGFNCKHYDQWILKASLLGLPPEQLKQISDDIIVRGIPGWQMPVFYGCGLRIQQFDLMDDCQKGLSLKAIEGHLGMDICETTIPFDIDRKLTAEEMDEVIHYCKHDVDATEMIYRLRKVYIENKLTLAKEKGIDPVTALGMTNAKLTAVYLDAKRQEHDDVRDYQYPSNLQREYIPQEVFDFFDRIKDPNISEDELFNEKITVDLGGTPTVIGFGGIHAAIPNYQFRGGVI